MCVFIYVIDCVSEMCFEAYDAIRIEFEFFDEVLFEKFEIVVLNKVDDIEVME